MIVCYKVVSLYVYRFIFRSVLYKVLGLCSYCMLILLLYRIIYVLCTTFLRLGLCFWLFAL